MQSLFETSQMATYEKFIIRRQFNTEYENYIRSVHFTTQNLHLDKFKPLIQN